MKSLVCSVAVAVLAGAVYAQGHKPAQPKQVSEKGKAYREAKQERHEVRKEVRTEHREDRKEVRAGKHEERKEGRVERREDRKESREEMAARAKRKDHFKAFLRKHPKLAKELFSRVDKDSNGELSRGERQEARAWMKKHQSRLRARYGERIAKFKEHLDANDDGKVSGKDFRRGRVIHKRLDRNDDGKVGKREWDAAKRVKKTMDLDKNGKVNRHEVRVSRRVVRRSDKNGDGKLGIRERHQAKRTMDKKSRRTVKRKAKK
jgi:hypothetical protein